MSTPPAQQSLPSLLGSAFFMQSTHSHASVGIAAGINTEYSKMKSLIMQAAYYALKSVLLQKGEMHWYRAQLVFPLDSIT